MKKKFVLLLLGPAGSGKSTFISSLSKFNIFEYISATEFGGANTTKVQTTYNFSKTAKNLKVLDCICSNINEQNTILNELRKLSHEVDGMQKIFDKINDANFAKKCSNITLELPLKETLLYENSLFDTIVVRDNRGFGDIDDKFNMEDLNLTYDVNAILFFSISAIQQPTIFNKIINNIMQSNLKTPMLLLRRDEYQVKNDKNFEEAILENLTSNDKDLFDAIKNLTKKNSKYRLNQFVFNLPEVKKWKGVLEFDETETSSEIQSYNDSVQDILTYSISMYDQLYEMLIHKMNTHYQELFYNSIFKKLDSIEALNIVAKIPSKPTCKPTNDDIIARDTLALSHPPKLNQNYNSESSIEPFTYEKQTRGNQFAYGKIPSYSYSCINFRKVFHSIIDALIDTPSLAPLFKTFIDIILKDSTTTTYSGYTFGSCMRDAFKFNQFIDARNLVTKKLIASNKNLSDEKGNWSEFSFTTSNVKFINYEAIVVSIYIELIAHLRETCDFYKDISIKEYSLKYTIDTNSLEIQEKILSRSK